MSKKRQATPVLQVGSTRVVAASEIAFGKPGRALVSLRYNVSSTGSSTKRKANRIESGRSNRLKDHFCSIK